MSLLLKKINSKSNMTLLRDELGSSIRLVNWPAGLLGKKGERERNRERERNGPNIL